MREREREERERASMLLLILFLTYIIKTLTLDNSILFISKLFIFSAFHMYQWSPPLYITNWGGDNSASSALQAPLPAAHCKLLYQQLTASSSISSALQAPLSARALQAPLSARALQAPLPAAHCKLLYQQHTTSQSHPTELNLCMIGWFARYNIIHKHWKNLTLHV